MSGNRLSLWSGSRGRNGLWIRPVDLVILLFVGLSVTFLLSSQAFGAPPSQGQPSASQPMQTQQSPTSVLRPDLTASITLSAKPRQSESGTCYTIEPTIIVTNQGQLGVSTPFKYVIEWDYAGVPWQVQTIGTIQSLGVGQSYTAVGPFNVATISLRWCLGDSITPAYRITVDSDHSVTESNEGNNIREKRYHPLPAIFKKMKKAL
jgi:hypothetical protein